MPFTCGSVFEHPTCGTCGEAFCPNDRLDSCDGECENCPNCCRCGHADDDVAPRGNADFDPRTCACDACKIRRFDRTSKLRHSVVRNYSYKPEWRCREIKDEHQPYYLGVELETDNYYYERGRMFRSEIDRRLAADMRRPKRFWVAKSDASVSGPEFVSHPATLNYWQSKRAELAEMFQMLVHAGYRSHDNDRCGMHVNISRSAFSSADHLYRFLYLIHTNASWSLKMSQRSSASASQWAALSEDMQDHGYCQSVAKSIMPVHEFRRSPYWGEQMGYEMVTYYPETEHRYIAVNAPYNEPRFEFRLPRGTLRIDRFYKNLEWTAAMIDYTREVKASECDPAPFMSWVQDNANSYPDLNGYINEKFRGDAAREAA